MKNHSGMKSCRHWQVSPRAVSTSLASVVTQSKWSESSKHLTEHPTVPLYQQHWLSKTQGTGRGEQMEAGKSEATVGYCVSPNFTWWKPNTCKTVRSWCYSGHQFLMNLWGQSPHGNIGILIKQGAPLHILCDLSLSCSCSLPHEETWRTHPSWTPCQETNQSWPWSWICSLYHYERYFSDIWAPSPWYIHYNRGFGKTHAFLRLNSLSEVQGFVGSIMYLRIPYSIDRASFHNKR